MITKTQYVVFFESFTSQQEAVQIFAGFKKTSRIFLFHVAVWNYVNFAKNSHREILKN